MYFKRVGADFVYVDEEFNEQECTLEEVAKKVENEISYPVFVKPSNSGSSVGIKKANNENELKSAIEYAGEYDKKIVIEE